MWHPGSPPDAFEVEAVHALADGTTRAELEQACEHLVRRDLLVAADGPALRFRHGLVREAAYASLAKSARARLHERHAAWLARRATRCPRPTPASRSTSRPRGATTRIGTSAPPELGVRAGARLAGAARVARGRGDLPGEIGFLDRAVAVLGPESEPGAELLPALVSALVEAGASARAEELARRAVAAGAALGLPRVGAWAAIEQERIRLSRHPEAFDVGVALVVAERAEEALRALGDELGLARAAYLRADLAWLTGDPVAAYGHAERMLVHARRAASSFDVATALTSWRGAWSTSRARSPRRSRAKGQCRRGGGHARAVRRAPRVAARQRSARARAVRTSPVSVSRS